jgi:CheY-like chemotaxis protein
MTNPPWKVLVVDDDEGIHSITRMVFRGYEFENREIELINASSSAQAKSLLNKHSDICVILLDVVMETDNAGLNLVNYIRKDLCNSDIRIILRTGHPGFAPEAEVIIDYDINDYLSKAELSASRLLTSVVVALRSFRDIFSAKNNLSSAKSATPQAPLTSQSLSEVAAFLGSKLAPIQSLSNDLLQFSHKPMIADIVANLTAQSAHIIRLNNLLQPTTNKAQSKLNLIDILDALINSYLNQAKREHWIADYQITDNTPRTIHLEQQWFNTLLLTLLEIAIYQADGNNLLINIHFREQRLCIAIHGISSQNSQENSWLKALEDRLDTLSSNYQGRIEIEQETLIAFSFILE